MELHALIDLALLTLCLEILPLYLGPAKYRSFSPPRDMAYRIMIVLRPCVLIVCAANGSSIMYFVGVVSYNHDHIQLAFYNSELLSKPTHPSLYQTQQATIPLYVAAS